MLDFGKLFAQKEEEELREAISQEDAENRAKILEELCEKEEAVKIIFPDGSVLEAKQVIILNSMSTITRPVPPEEQVEGEPNVVTQICGPDHHGFVVHGPFSLYDIDMFKSYIIHHLDQRAAEMMKAQLSALE